MSTEKKPGEKYFFSNLQLDADRKRLALQEQAWDPFTIRHLESLGVASGWTCLNVGAGHGSITAWIASRVSPTGKVVATDLRPELHREVSGQVEIRKHDIMKDEIEKNHYDLVFCRMLLQHLKEPNKALSKMADAVKPGGWLLIEEIDNSITPKSDSKNSKADYYYRTGWQYYEPFPKIGFDMEYGRNVRFLLDQLGFVGVQSEGNFLLSRGGDPWPEALVDVLKLSSEALIKSRLAQEDDTRKLLDEIERMYHDPSYYYICSALCSAWGKKPTK